MGDQWPSTGVDELRRLLLVGNMVQLLDGLFDVLERLGIFEHLMLRKELHVLDHLFHGLLHLGTLQLNPHRLLVTLGPRGIFGGYSLVEDVLYAHGTLPTPLQNWDRTLQRILAHRFGFDILFCEAESVEHQRDLIGGEAKLSREAFDVARRFVNLMSAFVDRDDGRNQAKNQARLADTRHADFATLAVFDQGTVSVFG